MDIISCDNGKFAIIKAKDNFVIVLNDHIIGPFQNDDKQTIQGIYNALKNA